MDLPLGPKEIIEKLLKAGWIDRAATVDQLFQGNDLSGILWTKDGKIAVKLLRSYCALGLPNSIEITVLLGLSGKIDPDSPAFPSRF
jgi:hypothetical protein